MKDNGTSESHQKNNLKTVISFTRYLGNGTNFYDIQRIEQIISFLTIIKYEHTNEIRLPYLYSG
jgi:hypothetical protein